jgi:prevent-host-death family protein
MAVIMHITEDIKSVSELKQHTYEIFKQTHRTGRPIVVTVNGKPDVVLLGAGAFRKID